MRRPSPGRLATITTAVLSAVAVLVGGIVIANSDEGSSGSAGAVVQQANKKPQEKPKYVALGSSFAAGPGDSRVTDKRCGRTADNYPDQVAAALNMRLVDATCSGATSADVLRPPRKHPDRKPQIDAVTPDTSLVTVTVGGNDIGYVGRIATSSCVNVMFGLVYLPSGKTCRSASTPSAFPTPAAYANVERALSDIAKAIRARAPKARIVFVDYPRIASINEMQCAGLPLEPWQVVETAMVGDNLAAATLRAAQANGAEVVKLQDSAQHTICSAQPWINGFGMRWPYHPNAEGKAAMAEQVIAALR